ncbi:MAG: hypothetical protein WA739_19150, partial [Candidatus Acidiferrales bacterium]
LSGDYLRRGFVLRGSFQLVCGDLRGLFVSNFPKNRIARGEFQIHVAAQTALAPFQHFAQDFAAGAFIAQKNALALHDLGFQIHHGAVLEDQCGLGWLGEKLAAIRSFDGRCALNGYRDFERSWLTRGHRPSWSFSRWFVNMTTSVAHPRALKLRTLIAARRGSPLALPAGSLQPG